MIVRRVVRLAGAVVLLGGVVGVGLATAPAWGATMFSGHGVTVAFDFGASGVPQAFNLNAGPPLAPFDPVAAGCPFDSGAAFLVTGNAVLHETTNNNGGWGGGTATGQAILQTSGGTTLYSGQATVWLGGGGNTTVPGAIGQAEEGETFHFHGKAVDPRNPVQFLDVSLDYHVTVNNNGTVTKQSEDLSCR